MTWVFFDIHDRVIYVATIHNTSMSDAPLVLSTMKPHIDGIHRVTGTSDWDVADSLEIICSRWGYK